MLFVHFKTKKNCYFGMTLVERLHCAVPENIHTPPMEGFLVWTTHPSGNSILVSYFPSKNRAFETPLPLRISVNLPWGGHGYFLELHILGLLVHAHLSKLWPVHQTSDESTLLTSQDTHPKGQPLNPKYDLNFPPPPCQLV